MSSSDPDPKPDPGADPRIAAYLSKNRAVCVLGVYREWAAGSTYQVPIPFLDMQRRGRERADGTVIIVACCDPRVTPEEFLGMDSVGKATVVRTAGGRIHPALNTLYILAAVGNEGKKGLILIVHHTDCGLCHVTDEEIRGSLKGRLVAGVDGMIFGSISDPEVTVKEDVATLKELSLFSGTQIVGCVMDTETGIVRQVV